MRTRITISLSETAIAVLSELALVERRDYREQAVYMLETALLENITLVADRSDAPHLFEVSADVVKAEARASLSKLETALGAELPLDDIPIA